MDNITKNSDSSNELEELRLRLAEAEETLDAIQNGRVDAVVVNNKEGTQVFTLKGADYAYRVLIEEMNEGVAILTKDSTIFYCNRKLASIFGIPMEKMIGRPIDEFIPLEHLKRCKITSQWGLSSKCKEELLLKVNNGTLVPVLVTLRFLKELNGCFIVINDLTQQKESEQELHDLMEDLKRSNEELQQFAYVSSHDLQEPLRAISSFTQLLERRYKGKFDKDADEFMDYVVEAAQRMQRMILDLLEYSRVVTKGDEFKEIDAMEALDEALFNLKATIESNGALITYNDIPAVIADKGQLIKVFQNIIANAVKFKKENEPPRIHISSMKDDESNMCIFGVHDNGIGMESQYTERIFTIFQRLHTLDEYKGTGIGLSIAKRIVDRHGGKIWVESELGIGSTFYFTFNSSPNQTK